MAATVKFDDVKVGDELPAHAKVVKREAVKAYADASGDQNPLHQDDAFAQSVGFPGIIAHGMFTMAHLTSGLTRWLGDPAALKRVKVQFRAVVFMDETIEAGDPRCVGKGGPSGGERVSDQEFHRGSPAGLAELCGRGASPARPERRWTGRAGRGPALRPFGTFPTGP